MSFKIVAYFTDDTFGWTETFHTSAANYIAWNGDNPNTLSTKLLSGQWSEARRKIMASACRLIRVKMSDNSDPGSYQIFTPADGFAQGLWEAAVGEQEAWTDLLLRFSATNRYHRNYYIAGVPTGQSVPPSTYTPNGKYADNVLSYIRLMSGGGYGMLPRPAKALAVPITNFVVDASGKAATVTAALLPPVGPTYKIIIRGLKTPYGWNGVHNASFINAGNHQLGPTKHPLPSTPVFDAQPGQTAQIFALPVMVPFTGGSAIKIVDKKRGGIFGRPRGRR